MDTKSLTEILAHPPARTTELRDDTPGLSVRVGPRGGSWTLRGRLRGRQSVWTVGDVAAIGIREARRRATEARALLARGEDPRDYLREAEVGPGAQPRRILPGRDGWDWETARDKFLEYVSEAKAESTADGYRRTLTAGYFDPLRGRLLKSLTADDGRRLRDSILAAGYVTQAQRSLAILKSCLSWCTDKAGSGIESVAISVVRKPAYEPEPGYVPTPDELGALFWRMRTLDVHESIRLAALLTLFTAQRIRTIVSAEVSDFTESPDGELVWEKDKMKTKSKKRLHVLPVFGVVESIITRAISLSPGSRYLFPQTRPRRLGMRTDGHIMAHSVSDVITPLATHSFRRAFATYGEAELRIPLSDLGDILDHTRPRTALKVPEVRANEPNPVTRRYYALSHRLDRKKETLSAWSNYLVTRIQWHGMKTDGLHAPDFLESLKPEELPEGITPEAELDEEIEYEMGQINPVAQKEARALVRRNPYIVRRKP